VNDVPSMWQKGRRRRDGEPDSDDSKMKGERNRRDRTAAADVEQDRCLSDLVLDRLALGECTPLERETARGHLGRCGSCAGAEAALAHDRRRFASETDVAALADETLARASRTAATQGRSARRLAPLLGLAMAAGTGFLLWTRAPLDQNLDRDTLDSESPGDETLDTRLHRRIQANNKTSEQTSKKGGFGIELFVKHAEDPGEGRLHLGESLHPGDRVRLRLAASPARQTGLEAPRGGESYLAVLAVDTTAQVSVYYPPDSPTALLADPAQVLLPGAIELDGALGGEVILAFSCPGPVAVRALIDAVQEAIDPRQVTTNPAAAVGGVNTPCVVARYRIEKVPPR
jgi:hypothetical protein